MSSDEEYSPTSVRRRRNNTSRSASQPYPTSRADSDDSEANKVTRERKGCLTCRVRRKKCTNEVVNGIAPKEPCKGCKRLHIECLGWSVKRPKWMRNKAIMDAMKRRIKDHLSGPVKSTSTKPTLSLAPYYKKTRDWSAPFPVIERQLYNPYDNFYDELDPRKSPQSPSSSLDDSHDYPFTPYVVEGYPHEPTITLGNQDDSPALNPSLIRALPTLSLQGLIPVCEESPTSESSTIPNDSFGSLSPRESLQDCAEDFPSSLPITYFTDPPQVAYADAVTFHNEQSLVPSNAPPPSPQDVYQAGLYVYQLPLPMDTIEFRTFTEWHRALRMFMYRYVPSDELTPFEMSEFVLGTGIKHEEALEATHNLIRLRDLGSVEHLGCAVSPLDQRRDLASQQNAVVLRLLQRSAIQPDERGNIVAALFGLSFSLFLGGSSGWQGCLEVACRWVHASWPLIEDGTAAPISKVFAGMTAWFDILGAVTLRQPPMLGMPLLAKMLARNSPVQLESIMGCENLVMFGIAYIATVAFEKRVRHLEDNCAALQNCGAFVRANFLQKTVIGPEQAPCIWDGMPPDPFALPSVAFPPAGDTPAPLWASETMPIPTVTSAFRVAAHVFLETTISGSHPQAPNVARATDAAMTTLKQILPSDADRNLIWPLCVVGCMTSRPVDQEYMAGRFALLEGRDKLGNGARAEVLMKYVWALRNSPTSDAAVDWIDAMGDFPILLA